MILKMWGGSMKSKAILLKLRDIILFGLLSTLVAYLIALLSSYVFDKNTFTVMYWIGMGVAVLGALSLGHGNPILMGSIASDHTNSGQQYMNYYNAESVRTERQITKYYDSIKNHGMSYYRRGGVNLFLNGAIVYLLTYLLDNLY